MTESAPSDAKEGSEQTEAPTLTYQRVVGFMLVVIACVIVLPHTQAEEDTTEGLTAQVIVREHTDDIGEGLAEIGATADNPVRVRVDYEGPEAGRKLSIQELQRLPQGEFLGETAPEAAATLKLMVSSLESDVRVRAEIIPERGNPFEAFSADKRAGRWTAIVPPLLAVLLALFFRRLIVALVAAVWMGAALQTDFHIFEATWMGVENYLWGSVADAFSLYIIAFTFSLVGMVQVITRMGGMQGVLEVFAGLARTARSTQVATACVGLAIFFDDYANTIVAGTTMRPMADKRRISREKLSYIVDSTSAPIAGIAIISTWIGYEVGLFDTLSTQLGMGMSGYEIFFEILPLRFYCIFALLFVFMNALSGRDFGPMREAELRARNTGDVLRPGSTPLTSNVLSDLEPAKHITAHWRNAVIPVATVIVGTMLGMFWSGWSGALPGGEPGAIPGVGEMLFGEADLGGFLAAWGQAAGDMGDWTAWRDAFSDADNAKVLFWAALVGSIVSIALAVGQRLLSLSDALLSWLKAVPAMWLAVAILVLAWAIQGVCGDLGTGIYLVGAVHDIITPVMLPVLTFLAAAVIAFATGTSWGTMGILLPAIIPLAFFMTQDPSIAGDAAAGLQGGGIILFLCFGAVLDGAIFGDHCSPISDTTVMSSIASSVDHLDHVHTQFPYAMTAMTAAAGFGYVGVAFGLHVVAAHVLGVAGLAGVLMVVGRKVRE
ncbi:MAG: Na+/H+ antiporter NhaC family protein [Persicimonas sp.]